MHLELRGLWRLSKAVERENASKRMGDKTSHAGQYIVRDA
jgi:hypothetical protein